MKNISYPSIIIWALLLACIFSLKTASAQVCITNAVKSSPLDWDGRKNVTISGLEISNSNGACIRLNKCSNITIRDCILGPSLKEGIWLYECKNITIINCSFTHNSTGVWAALSSGIKVIDNQFLNPQGPFPQGQHIMYNQVIGADNRVLDNVGECIQGSSVPEDLIVMFKSSGLPSDPILIKGNKLRGGGPSKTGGGINAGDWGGSYVTIEENILVNPGQYGIKVSSGTHHRLINNKVYSDAFAWVNEGVSIKNHYGPDGIDCNNIEVSNNLVNWTASTGFLMPYMNDGKCGTVKGWTTNTWNAKIDKTILPMKLLCQ